MNETRELPKGLPPLPEGYEYAGRLGDYGRGNKVFGIVVSDENSITQALGTEADPVEYASWSKPGHWHTFDSYEQTGAWHFARKKETK